MHGLPGSVLHDSDRIVTGHFPVQHFHLNSLNKYFTSMIQAVNFKALPGVNNGFLAMRVLEEHDIEFCVHFFSSDW